AGRSATLSISNGISTAKRTIFLLPAFTLAGSVDINYAGPTTTNAITPNATTTLQFTIRSRANFDATYAIDAVVSGPPNAQAWNNNLQILDESQNVVPSKSLQVFAGQIKPFFVSILVPSGATGSFDLAVTASAGAVSGSSGLQTFTVGQPAPQPDT